ncbi:hypothetical protein D6856_13930 [Butyrivibrio sp. XB500-5]|uniref:hypothetical protein n=1 Tax=Butyrivibrio sp. XB500-5 TaxID=2364880 RepID=UPI000EAA49EC|nr:hypothetical protein [Butyrivibrio sp. XB500-5]RKM57750.1 hypothetical protein D6856_13930 [Butyrivibrio sp. XB500-5]
MSKAKAAGLNLSDGSTLYLDNATYKARQNQLHQTASQLNFSKAPFEMENEVCGTEGMFLLADYWHGVSDSSDNLQSFLTTDVNKINSDVQNSINQTDAKIAGSFSTVGANSQANILEAVKYYVAHEKAKSIVSVSVLANVQAAKTAAYNALRAQFMSVYNIDEETMAQVEELIEKYEAGDPAVVTMLQKYHNKSESDWKNLSEEEYKEFAALTVLYAFSGYMVEKGANGGEGFETYNKICAQMTSQLYAVNTDNDEDKLFNDASLDYQLVYYMKAAMASMGASDCLSYNIMTKVEGDTNTYRVNNPDYYDKNVDVYFYYDENGFVSVNIQDSYFMNGSSPEHVNHFLATGKEHAADYIESLREGCSDYSNHGMTDDQLAGMFQAVSNPNDFKIMSNIVTSDSDFLNNGNNAFDIEYWEDYTNDFTYSKGISDTFSVALGQMPATMLNNLDTTNYNSFIGAVAEASMDSFGNHNILRDIASGAGVYADMCALNVMEDEQGDSNDYEIKTTLNSANATYGILSDLYGVLCDDTGTFQGAASYSNLDIKGLRYTPETGALEMDIEVDKDAGYFFWRDTTREQVTLKSNLLSGGDGQNALQENIQQDLKEELARKKANLAVDTLIDLTGCINPALKSGLAVVKDVSTQSDSTLHSVSLLKDGLNQAGIKSDGLNRTFSGASTLLGALSKYNSMEKEYEDSMNKSRNAQKLNSFYNYNTGSETVGLYDYDTIRMVQNWNDNGIVEVIGGNEGTNSRVYGSVVDSDNNIELDALRIIATDVYDKKHNFDKASADTIYEELEDIGYQKEDIENAVNVIVYGHCEEGNYNDITDIPFDLQNACLDAIVQNNTDINWEDFH